MHPSVSRNFEQLLIGPGQSALRAVLGFALAWVSAPWRAAAQPSFWTLLALLLAVLLALRLLLTAIRNILPFSQHLKAAWFQQRQLAKRFDSYQWSKLLWFGLGLATWLATQTQRRPGEIALVVVCLAAGSAGTFFWRRASAALVPAAGLVQAAPITFHDRRTEKQ